MILNFLSATPSVELLGIGRCQFVFGRMARANVLERLTCKLAAFVSTEFPNLAVVTDGCDEFK